VPQDNRLAIWNRRLLVGAATLTLLSATILAVDAADPAVGAVVTGEGQSFGDSDP